jgi:hypothetical protein
MSSSAAPSDATNVIERTPLLDAGHQGQKKPTPLPKLQISIVLFGLLVESIAGKFIYPYINQVGIFGMSKSRFIHCYTKLISELDIIGGDERKVGELITFLHEATFKIPSTTRVLRRAYRKFRRMVYN